MNICIKCSNHCSECEIIDQNQHILPKAGSLNENKICKYLGVGQEFLTFCTMTRMNSISTVSVHDTDM